MNPSVSPDGEPAPFDKGALKAGWGEIVNVNISKKVFNAVYLPLLECPERYMVLYGGAGSGKSYFIAQRYIYRLLQEDMLNLLAVRAVGVTNRDSTFALFKQIIARWGLSKLFKVNESDLRITCLVNRNSVLFKGLDDTEKLKSITFEKGELTDVWIEEASEVEERDFNQLDLRLRGKGTRKQITASFNPVDVNHWLKRRFFDERQSNMTVLHTTYKDNAFLDDDYKALLESYKDTDPYYFAVYCLGEWGVYGKTVFDAEKVSERLASVKTIHRKKCEFVYEYDGKNVTEPRITDGDWITIYKEPEEGYPYVIGADTAGEGSDFFAAQVVNNVTGEQVAALHIDGSDEDIFARQIYCLGKYYNDALVAVEANFSSYSIKELQRLGYTKQYVRQTEDRYTHRTVDSFGFRTTALTRPVAIAGLVEIVREHTELINDEATLLEMLTFVRNEKGRPEAQAGAHDDLVMALAITYYTRNQQSGKVLTPTPERVEWREEKIKDYLAASPEDREYLIKKWGVPANLNI